LRPITSTSTARWAAEHVRELFGGRVASLEMTRRQYVERADSSRANQGPSEGPAELHYEYLLVVARKPGA
jgi:hypothetical protein